MDPHQHQFLGNIGYSYPPWPSSGGRFMRDRPSTGSAWEDNLDATLIRHRLSSPIMRPTATASLRVSATTVPTQQQSPQVRCPAHHCQVQAPAQDRCSRHRCRSPSRGRRLYCEACCRDMAFRSQALASRNTPRQAQPQPQPVNIHIQVSPSRNDPRPALDRSSQRSRPRCCSTHFYSHCHHDP